MLRNNIIVIPAIMPTLLDRGTESTPLELPQKPGILTSTGEATKRLGIVIATAVALHGQLLAQNIPVANSSPSATLQATKGSGVLTIDGKNLSFMEFLKSYPNQAERGVILAKMDRSTKSAFRDWELSIETDNINGKKVTLNQKQGEEKNVDAAIDLSKQLEVTLDEVFAEQGLNSGTPEIVAKNKKRGAIILSALANPLIGGKLPSSSQGMLQILGESLLQGYSPVYASEKMAIALKAEIKRMP